MLLNVAAEKAIKGGAKPLDSRKQKSSLNNTIFRIVTSGLYIRPIEAIVRELCTNALDGHIAANKADVPFDVVLPTTFDPYFIVRDYGCSMDKDVMFDIYGVLGESTKNTSSKEIGGWGVGGKSPYAYTDTFFITTYLNGLKRVYQGSALADESPLELLIETPSDEPQGVEVKVPVQEKDFNRFVTAAETQLAPFHVKPNINGASNFEYAYAFDEASREKFEVSLYLPNADGSALELRKQKVEAIVNSEYSSPFAIQMGCVIYPINVTAENYEEFQTNLFKIKTLTGKKSFIFQLPVDAVDIKPSREDLDYTERTNKVLKGIIDKIYAVSLKDFITLKRAVRQMPYEKAAEYLAEKASKDVLKYYIENVKHYNPYKKRYEKFSAYKIELRNYFIGTLNEYTYTFIQNFVGALPPRTQQHPFYSFDKIKVVSTTEETAKNFSDLSYRLAISGEQKITVFLKSPSYVKKVKYYLEESFNFNSQLYPHSCLSLLESYYIPYRRINESDEEHAKRVQKFLKIGSCLSHAALCFSSEELEFFKPVLEKLYGTVEVIDTKSLPVGEPSQVEKQRAIPNTRLCYKYFCYREASKDVIHDTDDIRVKYSYEEFEYFLEALHNDMEYRGCTSYELVLYDRDRGLPNVYRGTAFREMLLLKKKSVVLVAAPPKFAERLLKCKKYLISDIYQFTSDLIASISPRVKEALIRQTVLNNIYDKTIYAIKYDWRDYGNKAYRDASKLAVELLRNPTLSKHFFKFLVPYRPRKIKYEALATFFYDDAYSSTYRTQAAWENLQAETLAKRVLYRLAVLLEKREMLKLVFACDEFVSSYEQVGITMHRYLQHMLKGIPNDDTETSAD